MTDEIDKFLHQHDAPVASHVDAQATETQPKKRKNMQEQDINKKPKVQENRAIYVTNLPSDTTEQELEQTFKKYGIIDQGTDGRPRIKMYYDEEGKFNGEALIVYFRKDSIVLAIRMMDEYFFRIEDQSIGTIRVKEADFSYKHNKDTDQIASKLTRQDRKISERTRADLNRKLAEWSDNEEEVAEVYAPKKNKWAKVVILKHVFTLRELEEAVEAYLEIKEDIRTEAARHGKVTNVTLFDKEEDGICTVRFSDFSAAEKFAAVSNGRRFGGDRIEASLASDKPKFKKSGRAEEPESEDEEA